jgi:hypothetical protein
MKKLTLEEVKGVFEDGGCELIEETYINNSVPLKYRCSCSSVGKISLNHFKKGSRCKRCGVEKISKSRKYSIDKVRDIFDKEGCELLSDVYGNQNLLMDYRCSCGSVSRITLSSFVKGHRCKKCGYEKVSISRKYSTDDVKKIFQKEGCKLLGKKYEGSSQNLKYKCSCGSVGFITLDRFIKGQRCRGCGIKKISGKNSYNWNKDLTKEDRLIKRNYPEYKKWRIDIYDRDDYICKKCNIKGRYLNAHHINNYSTNKELRLEISNGVTFCEDCHKGFHKIYGRQNNTKEQYNEFIKIGVKNV